MPVLASNLLMLAHGRQNIDKLFLENSYLPGCCIAKIAFRRRHLFVLCTGVWKLDTAVQCCQHVDKLLQVNDDAIVAKGYEHIWASYGYRLKWAFVVALMMWKHVRPCVRLATPLAMNANTTVTYTKVV